MHRVDFDLKMPSSAYSVLIGERLDRFFDALINVVGGKKALILSDGGAAEAALAPICEALVKGGTNYIVHILHGGESDKSFDSLKAVLNALIEDGFTRNDFIINLGGGVVGDLGGFAAAVFMRGIDYINIPTTLLSMIDSSMGGKTGIDHFGIKNAVGAFHQPRLVICASELLSTLPERELRSGFGEVLKYYCISGSSSIRSALTERRADPSLIEECCRIKRDHVSADIHDMGRRRMLNLGHTFGHAFEAASGFELSHGEAVAMGLAAAMRFGEKLGITKSGVSEETAELARTLGISASPSAYSAYADKAAALLAHDKKSSDGGIDMVFIERFGSPLLKRVPVEAAAEFLLDRRG